MATSFSNIKKDIDSMDRVTFGKHSGNTWYWVMENYPDYIIWCVGNTDMKFSYDLIVDAIKSKYKKKAEAKSVEVDGEYDPKLHKSKDIDPDLVPKKPASFYSIDSVFGKVFDKHHGHEFATKHVDDSWDDDVPF